MSNSKIFSQTKPITHIQTLQNSLLNVFSMRKSKPGQRFPLMVNNKKMCFSLVQGECEFKRSTDSLLFGILKAPLLIGISDLVIDHENILIQAITPVEYMHLPLDDFLSHIDTYSLWKPLTHTLMYMSARSHDYTQLNTALSSYELICNYLRALIDEDFERRATIPAVQYIMDRTQLSRSGVLKTLSELNAGGYIVIKRGLLIKINKLPSKY